MKCDPLYIKLLKEPKRRVRWLTEPEALRLIKTLPEHVADMATLALETGLIESNITLLRWDQVDFSQRIIYVILKSDLAFVVPLSDIAVDVIKRQIGKSIRRANTKVFKSVSLNWV